MRMKEHKWRWRKSSEVNNWPSACWSWPPSPQTQHLWSRLLCRASARPAEETTRKLQVNVLLRHTQFHLPLKSLRTFCEILLAAESDKKMDISSVQIFNWRHGSVYFLEAWCLPYICINSSSAYGLHFLIKVKIHKLFSWFSLFIYLLKYNFCFNNA